MRELLGRMVRWLALWVLRLGWGIGKGQELSLVLSSKGEGGVGVEARLVPKRKM